MPSSPIATRRLRAGYLSATTLSGLALNAVFGLWWADPVAALIIAVFLIREAREAWEGDDHAE